jgi:hypothetical protein
MKPAPIAGPNDGMSMATYMPLSRPRSGAVGVIDRAIHTPSDATPVVPGTLGREP